MMFLEALDDESLVILFVEAVERFNETNGEESGPAMNALHEEILWRMARCVKYSQ